MITKLSTNADKVNMNDPLGSYTKLDDVLVSKSQNNN